MNRLSLITAGTGPMLVLLLLLSSCELQAVETVSTQVYLKQLKVKQELERLRLENENLRLRLGLKVEERKETVTLKRSLPTLTTPTVSTLSIVSTGYSRLPTLPLTRYGHPPRSLREVRTPCPYRHGRWVSGHWVWARHQYYWQPGSWIDLSPCRTIVRPPIMSKHESRKNHSPDQRKRKDRPGTSIVLRF